MIRGAGKDSFADIFCITGMIIAWSSYYLASNYTVGQTGSAFVAGMLLRAGAFVFLTAYIIAKGKFKQLFRQGKVAIVLFVVGILGFLLDTFANVGFKYGSVGTGTVLLKTDILMANIATVLFFGEKLKWTDWAATAVMFAGVIMVLDIDFAAASFNWYDLFFIASALSVTVNAFVIKSTQVNLDVDSDIIGYYNNFVVLLLFAVSALIAGDFRSWDASALGWEFWLIVCAGGIAQSLIYVFYYRNLKHHPVWKVKLYLLFVPVISCIVGALALNESFGVLKGVGIALVLLGAVVIVLRNKLFVGKIDRLANTEYFAERKYYEIV